MKKLCSFSTFKKILLESMLSEGKSRLIDKLVLPDIENEEEKEKVRDEMKVFFKRYSNWENKLDWNKLKTITYSDFEKIKDQATRTKGAHKKAIASDLKNIFKSVDNRKFKIVGENDEWLFVAPLTYEAAVYCDSSENQGGSAKWCIGYEEDDSYWIRYIKINKSLFIMAFNKNYKSLSSKDLRTNLKYMIEKEKNGTINVWNQRDNSINFNLSKFEISSDQLNSMFNDVKKEFKKLKTEKEKEIKLNIKNKIDNLKNLSKIDEDYFTEEEKNLITEIDIPNNIKEIKKNAFASCSTLTHVVIPDSVTSIGYAAFSGCTSLTSVTIPESVTDIGEYAFSGCGSLVTVTIPDSVTSIERYAFYGCIRLTSVTIPDSVTDIGYSAFSACISLASITIPDSVTSIGSYAFSDCHSLTSVTIPDSVRDIGGWVFYHCVNLTRVTIGASVKSIGYAAFSKCDNLSSIIFKGKTINKINSMKYYPWSIENPDKIIEIK